MIEKYTAKDEQTITTPEIEKSAETGITDDALLFDESIIAEAGLGFVPDKELESSGNNEQNYEQLTLFGEPEPINKSAPTQNYTPIQYGEPVADVNRFEELHKEIMRGSGFQGGKFRIAEFFQEHNPNNKEFADFLKNEYGTGGHTADDNIFMVDYDSKGMQFTVRSTEGGISDEKFDFNWTEVAKLTADLIKHDKYITQDDIARRNKREDKVEKSEQEVKVNEKSQNFTITDDKLGEGGAKTKFRNNLLAIQTLKQIEIEDRKATPEEQESCQNTLAGAVWHKLSIPTMNSGARNGHSFSRHLHRKSMTKQGVPFWTAFSPHLRLLTASMEHLENSALRVEISLNHLAVSATS